MRLTPVLLITLLALSTATAQVGIQNPNTSTPTTLYFHLDANQDFPINTQLPDDRFARSSDLGLIGLTTSCIPDPSGQAGVISQSFHTRYGFSTPGYVEYGFSDQGGPRIHPERGLAEDVILDPSAPAELRWFLETRVLGDSRNTPDDTETLPVIVPQVTVRATIRQGDDVSVGSEAYNSGAVIAEGTSEPMDMRPDEANPYYHELDDGKHLYEFVVPLDVGAGTIPKDEAYNVRIDTYLQVPGCDSDPDASLMTSSTRVHTSPEFRPRIDWSVMNPLSIEYIHPQIVGDALVVHTAMSSPWGNYDVDESPSGITVAVEGPSEARSLTRTAFVQRHHEHNHHFKPVDVTYSWPYEVDGAEDGMYTIIVTARNDQGTAQAVGRAAFELGANVGLDSDGNRVEQVKVESEQESPAAPLMLLLAALGLAATRRR